MATPPESPTEPGEAVNAAEPVQPAGASGMSRFVVALGILVLAAVAVGAILVLKPKPLPALHLTARGASPSATAATGLLPELKAGSYTGIKPAVIGLSADGGDWITRIHWSSWTATKAVGTGTRTLQSCRPSCAQGNDTEVPERLVLSDPESGYFTVIVATFAGQIAEYTEGTGLWPLAAEQTSQG